MTSERSKDSILNLSMSIATVLYPRETVSVLTFWKSVVRKVCEAAEYASRSSGFSSSAILVLLLYAVALYGFMTSSDWTDPDEFARVMIIACVSLSEETISQLLFKYCFMVDVRVCAGGPGGDFSDL
jgi:hypothetical protein